MSALLLATSIRSAAMATRAAAAEPLQSQSRWCRSISQLGHERRRTGRARCRTAAGKQDRANVRAEPAARFQTSAAARAGRFVAIPIGRSAITMKRRRVRPGQLRPTPGRRQRDSSWCRHSPAPAKDLGSWEFRLRARPSDPGVSNSGTGCARVRQERAQSCPGFKRVRPGFPRSRSGFVPPSGAAAVGSIAFAESVLARGIACVQATRRTAPFGCSIIAYIRKVNSIVWHTRCVARLRPRELDSSSANWRVRRSPETLARRTLWTMDCWRPPMAHSP